MDKALLLSFGPAATPPVVLAPGAALEALEPCYPEAPGLFVFDSAAPFFTFEPTCGLAGDPFYDVLPIPTPLGDVDF